MAASRYLLVAVFVTTASAWTLPFQQLFVNQGVEPRPNTTSSGEAVNLTSSQPPASNISTDSSPRLRRSTGEQEMLCNTVLQNIAVIQARVAMSVINNFKEDYVGTKFFTSWAGIDAFFNRNHDHRHLTVCDGSGCDQVLPTLPPSPHHPPTTRQEVRQEMAKVAGFIQQYIIALEQLFLDQSLTEPSANERSFMREMDEVYRLMEALNAVFLQGIEHCGVVPDVSPVSELSRKIYIYTSNTSKYRRGFMALRQCLLGLQYLVDVFASNSSTTTLQH
nr:uncharacterized protein LOC123751425 [Procambarus clarkii]